MNVKWFLFDNYYVCNLPFIHYKKCKTPNFEYDFNYNINR